MQFEGPNEKAPIAPMPISQLTSKQDYAPNNNVKKTRITLLILLAVHMVLAWLYFIEHIVGLAKYYDASKEIRDHEAAFPYISNVISGAVLILYLIIYIIVVVQYMRIGILIFAWLGILELLGLVLVIVFAIIAIVAFSTTSHYAAVGIVFSVILLIIAIFTFIFTMLTVIFSFKLAKLIKIQHTYQLI
ncbi:unnamed protein product [Rotaria sp. Silwood1]|nr:unnamed protein product [Rotaria sp. Silwood1]CAF1410781.1 unnamed protein product [Rotaria sp. Silwood1]CAF1415742.1 unnamed protein product [Rotaria sp. Silwood1]CAF3550872.1 unnamed protein product [Rotaria sp. Silwood1]CAF3599832.1 unnamed protein product [Rotaria sp. Silwood1]